MYLYNIFTLTCRHVRLCVFVGSLISRLHAHTQCTPQPARLHLATEDMSASERNRQYAALNRALKSAPAAVLLRWYRATRGKAVFERQQSLGHCLVWPRYMYAYVGIVHVPLYINI
jgi:hypothetical protein